MTILFYFYNLPATIWTFFLNRKAYQKTKLFYKFDIWIRSFKKHLIYLIHSNSLLHFMYGCVVVFPVQNFLWWHNNLNYIKYLHRCVNVLTNT